MIESVHIRNFQSHKSTKLIFDKGVNVIIGETDSGKSAIIRALKWGITNTPKGVAFCSNWGGDTLVRIKEKSHIITRKKTKSSNIYKLDDTVFKAFGNDIPAEIDDVLNMNDINIQNQLDSPYLLSKSPGAVAQHFNKIANLEKIDTGIDNIQSEIRTIQQDIRMQDSIITDETENLKGYTYLDKFEIDIENIEILHKSYITVINKKSKLSILIDEINTVVTEIDEYKSLLGLDKLLLLLEKIIIEKNTIINDKDILNHLCIKIQQNQYEINKEHKIIVLDNVINKIIPKITQKDELKEKSKQLLKLIDAIVYNNDRIDKGITYLRKKELEYKENFPDVCPLCGTIIKK